MLGNFAAAAVAVVVVRTRSRAILLAMITMRKSIYGFPSLSYMSNNFASELVENRSF